MSINVQSQYSEAISNAVTNAMTSVANSFVDTNTQTSEQYQINQVNFGILSDGKGGQLPCPSDFKGNISILNKSTAQNRLQASEVASFSTDVKNSIINNIQQAIQQLQKSTQGFLSFGIDNQSNTSIVGSYIANNIVSTISNQNTYVCSQSNLIDQQNNVYFCGQYEKDILVTNNASATLYAGCLSSLVSNTLVQDQATNNVLQSIQQSEISEQKGIEALGIMAIAIAIILGIFLIGVIAIGKYMEKGPLKYFVIFVFILIGLALIALAAYFGIREYNIYINTSVANIVPVVIDASNSSIALTFYNSTGFVSGGPFQIQTTIPTGTYKRGEYLAFMLQGAINSKIVELQNTFSSNNSISVIFNPTDNTLNFTSKSNVGFTVDSVANSIYATIGLSTTTNPNTVAITSPLPAPK